MTTKYLTGYYASGYRLNTKYDALDIRSTAKVTGTGVGTYQLTSVTNEGVIESTNWGIENWLGNVTNGSGANTKASIEGVVGVLISHGPGTLKNFGTIIGTSDQGADLQEGGAVINGSLTNRTAIIEGVQGSGLRTDNGAATVQNFGTLLSQGATYAWDAGFFGDSGGVRLTNGAATDQQALIAGYNGVVMVTAGTVTNFGTIESDVAGSGQGHSVYFILFQAQDDHLVAEAGSVLVGEATVNAGSIRVVSGTAQFMGGIVSAGSISGAGTVELEGGTTKFEPGASLTVANIDQVSGATEVAQTLTDAGAWIQSGGQLAVDPGFTFHLSQASFDGGIIAGSGVVTVAAGDIEALTVAGSALVEVVGAVSETGSVKLSGGGLTFDGDGAVVTGAISGVGALRFAGGETTLEGAHLTARTMTMSGSAVTLVGTITTAGGVNLSGSSAGTSLIVGAGGATLQGGAWALTTREGKAIVVKGLAASDTLTIADSTLSGAGRLGEGEMSLVVSSQGTVAARGSSALVIDTGTNQIANSGLIEAVSGAGVRIESAVLNDGPEGRLEANGATLTVLRAVTGSGSAVIAKGALVFDAAFNQNVAFTGSTGSLALAKSQAYTATISGFSAQGGTSLDLKDIGFTGSAEASFSGGATSGVLTISDGTHTARIALLGDYLGATFTASSDGSGGTSVTASGGAAAAPPHAFVSAMAAVPSAPSAASAHARGADRRDELPNLVHPA